MPIPISLVIRVGKIVLGGLGGTAAACIVTDKIDDYKYRFDGFNSNGYDRYGYNRDGYDEYGYDKNGYNHEGYSVAGYDHEGFNKDGFDKNGYNRNGYDRNGFDIAGYDCNGYDKEGFNKDGYSIDGYNLDGYSSQGYNRNGFNKLGYNIAGFDVDGYDVSGYDKEGYNRYGFDKTGYNREGYDYNGYDHEGYNKTGLDNAGNCKQFYCDQLGSYRRRLDEASAEVYTGKYRYAVYDVRVVTENTLRLVVQHCSRYRDGQNQTLDENITTCETNNYLKQSSNDIEENSLYKRLFEVKQICNGNTHEINYEEKLSMGTVNFILDTSYDLIDIAEEVLSCCA